MISHIYSLNRYGKKCYFQCSRDNINLGFFFILPVEIVKGTKEDVFMLLGI